MSDEATERTAVATARTDGTAAHRRKLMGTARGTLMLLGGGLGIVIYSLAIGVMAFFSAAPSPAATPDGRLATTAGIVGLLGLVGFVTLQHRRTRPANRTLPTVY